jgi:hypothetical protein
VAATFKKIRPPAGAGQLSAFEARHSLSLPDDYRRFLLHHNGGVPQPAGVHVSQLKTEVLVDVFALTSRQGLSLDEWIAEFEGEIPTGFLIIAGDPGGAFFILGTQGEERGVYLWDHQHRYPGSSEEEGNTFFLSDSFTSWIESFHEMSRRDDDESDT